MAKVTKVNKIPKDVFDQVRKEFTSKGNSAREIKKAILDDMSVGVSPVEGERWKKYSNSYKDVLRGLISFRTNKNTKQVYKIPRPDEEILRHGKSIAPVNLKLSGDLYKSLKVSTTGRVILIAFESIIALYHNNLGASKKKVIRRMLPTESGEKFNEGITQRIEALIKNAVDIVVKRINRQ